VVGATESIGGGDGIFGAYVAAPRFERHGAVIVLHEMFGVNAFMRGVCDSLAARGYRAICPDLYWRLSPGVELSDGSGAEIERGLSLLAAFDHEAALRDLAQTCVHLRQRIGAADKIAAIGYCLGGLLAYRAVARELVDCGVSYYGSGIHERLDERYAISRPLLLHVPDKDQTTPPGAAAAIADAFAGHPSVSVYLYPGLDHAFARVDTKYFQYVPDAADLADRRTDEFLEAWLSDKAIARASTVN